jgi:peroxiredoxin
VINRAHGVWCPYCNLDLPGAAAALPAITALGAQLIAISPQTASNSGKSERENKVTFPLLSDPVNEVAARFGLRFRLRDYLIELYRDTFKNDLTRINGDSSWTLPMPARYVSGTDGVIEYAEVNPDYTQRPDPEELLPVLRKMQETVAT